MKVINVEQKSAEWLALRKNYITATDYAKIAGILGYCEPKFCKSEFDFWQDKENPKDISENPFVKWGVEREDIVMQKCKAALWDDNLEAVVAVNEQLGLLASFDAISDTNVVEIKTSGNMTETLLHYYVHQLYAQYLVSNSSNRDYYIAYEPRHGTFNNFYAGEVELIKVEFVTAENSTVAIIKNKTYALAHVDAIHDFVKNKTKKTNTIYSEYAQISKQIEELTIKQKELKTEIEKLGAYKDNDVHVYATARCSYDKQKAFNELCNDKQSYVTYDVDKFFKEVENMEDYLTAKKITYSIKLK